MLLKTLLANRWLIRLIPIAFISLFIFAFSFTYVNVIRRRRSFSFDTLPICDAKTEAIVTDRNYSVVLWTSYFGEVNHPSFDDSPFDSDRCSYNNCEFFTDREIALQADAIVFHQADVNLKDMPKTRRPHQRWVMFNQESPPNSFNLSPAFDGIFNWSMTYHHRDDVIVPYFETCRRETNTSEDLTVNILNVDDKSWAAVWFVSNCRTSSNRMSYVKELQKYFSVDIIGACSPRNIKCPKSNHKSCLDTFLPKYRFVLAFENSICSDYVTEKLRNVLPYDVIPIFWGGVDYGRFLPRETFIVASDYPNPKDLARALYRFRNNELFRRTLAYRKGIEARGINWKCRLCEKLNESHGKTTIRYDLYKATHLRGKCKFWRRNHLFDHHVFVSLSESSEKRGRTTRNH